MVKLKAILDAVNEAGSLREARAVVKKAATDKRRRVTEQMRRKIYQLSEKRGLNAPEIQSELLRKNGWSLSVPTVRKVIKEKQKC